jgi:Asp-tRNA(Asn)/Glu-tRNA(Gln) amidotransferase A subunit family amidase
VTALQENDMKRPATLSARELAAAIARRELTVESVVRDCLERIEAREEHVRAWQFLDPELPLAYARRLDAQGPHGLLFGVPLGVKDLMDTADMPTTYGSPIYAGHRPAVDAASVAAARAAGAVIMGKTVTTEFATFKPGPTRNPRAPDDGRPHTPGGSSSGSAAAVAAGMVPLAFGTQTAGSIIRPAAYCGVVGYKPTFGILPWAGIKSQSPSLDTVGVLARTVDDAAFFVGALSLLALDVSSPATPRIGVCRTPHWHSASDDAQTVLFDAARCFEQTGAVPADVELPAVCDGLAEAQSRIMGFEAAAAFAPESLTQADGFSPTFAKLLADGRAVGGDAYFAAQKLATEARLAIDNVFMQYDVLLAPSVHGEAPSGLDATGDPLFNRLWSLLGNPCVHVPVGTGRGGMPLGVTVIGPRWGDARTLAIAGVLEAAVSRQN